MRVGSFPVGKEWEGGSAVGIAWMQKQSGQSKVSSGVVRLDPRLRWRVSDKEGKVGWAGARLWVLTIVVGLKKWDSHLFRVYVCVCFIEKLQTEVEWTILRIPIPDTIIIKIDHICFLFLIPCWSYFRGNPRYCIISLLQTSVCVSEK